MGTQNVSSSLACQHAAFLFNSGFRYCATFSSQAYELLEETLFDPSEKVAKTSREVFLPSFAAWAQDLDKVESHLFTSLISIVENALKVRCLFKCLDTILDLTF